MSKQESKGEKVRSKKDDSRKREDIWLPRAAGMRSDIDDLTINGTKARAVLGDGLIEADLERTIEGASTITVKVPDPNRDLIESAICKQRSIAVIDHLRFELASIAYDEDDDATLVFEDEVVAILKRMYGYKKAFRKKTTRAEFIHSLIREANKKKHARIGWRSREEHVKQPVKAIENEREARENDKEKDHERKPGLGRADRSRITVKHEAVSLAELHVIDTVLDVGMSMGADYKVLVCSIMTITQETHAQNLNSGSAGMGPFSQEPGTWGQDYPGASLDVAECAKGFFQVALQIDKKEPGKNYDTLCQAVQKSAYPDAYAQWEDEAKHTVDVYLKGADAGSGGGTLEKTIIKPYSYERRKHENSWDCAKRLAEEVNWRRFVLAGYFYYMSERQLFSGRTRARIAMDEPGVDKIPFEHDTGKPVTELSPVVWARTWGLPPGCVVDVDDCGPANGLYLIGSTSKSLIYDTDRVTIDCKKPMKQLAEPAPETETKSISVGGGARGETSASTEALDEVKITNASPGSPYWGGAHAIFKQFVTPFMEDHGLQPGSEKRSYNTGDGTSDHYVGSTLAYATDYPTTNGEGIARAIAAAMGFTSWKSNSYTSFTIKVDGYTFEVQVLWGAAIEHGDHVHVGMHRV